MEQEQHLLHVYSQEKKSDLMICIQKYILEIWKKKKIIVITINNQTN